MRTFLSLNTEVTTVPDLSRGISKTSQWPPPLQQGRTCRGPQAGPPEQVLVWWIPLFHFDPDAVLGSQDELSHWPQIFTCLTSFHIEATQNWAQDHLFLHQGESLTWGALRTHQRQFRVWKCETAGAKPVLLLPMQLRSPAEKGRYAYGGLPTEFSGRKRSGLNSSGSGKYRGSRWRA